MPRQKKERRSPNYKAIVERFFGGISPVQVFAISEKTHNQGARAVLKLGDLMALVEEASRRIKDQSREHRRGIQNPNIERRQVRNAKRRGGK